MISKEQSIDAILARARSRLMRVAAADLDEAVADGALLVDIRPIEQRQRDGDLPGCDSCRPQCPGVATGAKQQCSHDGRR